MSDFFEDFLRDGQKEAGTKPRSASSFAFLGKYPAWDDYFSEGDQTRSLATLFRLLRSGVQEAKSAEAEVATKTDPLAIDHLFFWHRGAQGLIGAVWASHDSSASGERRFPVSASVHSTNLSSAASIDAGFALVTDFREVAAALPVHLGYKSREERSQLQERIRTEIELARKRLSSAAGSDLPTNSRLSQECASQLMAAPASGAHWDGVIQAVDGFRRRFVSHRASLRRPPGSESRLGTAVQRFPDLFGDSFKTILFWRALLSAQLDPEIPLLWIAPRSGGWVDLVAGEPSPKLWASFCVSGSGPQILDERPDASAPPDWLRPRIGEAVQALSLGGVMPSLFEGSQSQDRTPSTVILAPTASAGTPPAAAAPAPVPRKDPATPVHPVRKNVPASQPSSNQGIWIAIGALASLAGILILTKDVVFPPRGGKLASAPPSTGVTDGVASAPPGIVRQPVNTTIVSGEKATLMVETRISGPYSYAWEREGAPGRWEGTNRELVLVATPVQAGRSFQYRCIVRGHGGMATSSWATLTVRPLDSGVADAAKKGPASGSDRSVSAPEIAGLPPSVEKTEGEPLELSATVSGDGPIRFAWYRSRIVLPESTNNTLKIAATTTNSAGPYELVASNKGGSVTSKVVNVTIKRRRPSFELAATNVVLAQGSEGFLEVKARDADQIRWMRDGKPIWNEAKLKLAVRSTDQGGLYEVEVSNGDYSTNGRVFVQVTPRVVDVAQDGTLDFETNRHVRLGAPFALRVRVGESAAFQWFKGDAKMPLVNGGEFRRPAAEKGDTSVYRVFAGTNLVQTFRVWVERTNSIGMAFVWVPELTSVDGTRILGGWVGKYEVSVREWNSIMRRIDEDPSLPVSNVSFEAAENFCNLLTVGQNPNGLGQSATRRGEFVLPTKLQWLSYARTNDVDGAIISVSTQRTSRAPVTNGQVRANGLYNTLGNVGEFCTLGSTNALMAGGSYRNTIKNLGNYMFIERPRSVPNPEWGFRCIMLVD